MGPSPVSGALPTQRPNRCFQPRRCNVDNWPCRVPAVPDLSRGSGRAVDKFWHVCCIACTLGASQRAAASASRYAAHSAPRVGAGDEGQPHHNESVEDPGGSAEPHESRRRPSNRCHCRIACTHRLHPSTNRSQHLRAKHQFNGEPRIRGADDGGSSANRCRSSLRTSIS